VNWIVFALVAWVLFGLELGLRDLLAIGPGGIAPSFVLPLVVYVALSAPGRTAVWAAAALGLVMDLTRVVDLEGGGVTTVAGPYVLAYAGGAYALLVVRPLMYRRNPLTVAVLTGGAGVMAQIVVVALTTVRSVYDPVAFSPAAELMVRLASAVYSVLTGGLVAMALMPLTDLFRFQHVTGGFGRRPPR